MSELKHILGPMRVPFLILNPACILLGIATAVWTSGKVSLLYSILALIGAIAAHISVNVLNEYFDFRSGLDSRTRRTPFSGGSGTLQSIPQSAHSTLATGLVALAITSLIGIYFLSLRGLALLPLGLLGLLIIVTYTPWLSKNPTLCLIAPGLGFGTLMVMGTNFVLTGEYTWTAFVASLVPFFLVSNLLLLNQFPDVEADQAVGRRHLPIVAGRRTGSLVYAGFMLLTYLSILLGAWSGYLPKTSLLGLCTIPLAISATMGAFRYKEDIGKLIPSMGVNVLINITTPVLVAIGLFLG